MTTVERRKADQRWKSVAAAVRGGLVGLALAVAVHTESFWWGLAVYFGAELAADAGVSMVRAWIDLRKEGMR